jgi:hypothetical protein
MRSPLFQLSPVFGSRNRLSPGLAGKVGQKWAFVRHRLILGGARSRTRLGYSVITASCTTFALWHHAVYTRPAAPQPCGSPSMGIPLPLHGYSVDASRAGGMLPDPLLDSILALLPCSAVGKQGAGDKALVTVPPCITSSGRKNPRPGGPVRLLAQPETSATGSRARRDCLGARRRLCGRRPGS